MSGKGYYLNLQKTVQDSIKKLDKVHPELISPIYEEIKAFNRDQKHLKRTPKIDKEAFFSIIVYELLSLGFLAKESVYSFVNAICFIEKDLATDAVYRKVPTPK